MAPRTKETARAGALDSACDSEDDLAANTIQAKAGATTKTTAKKMPKAKAATSRASGVKAATKRKAAPKQTRQALKDRTNLPDGNETEEVEGFEEDDIEDAPKPKAKRAKTTTTRKNAAKTAASKDEEEVVSKPAPARRGRQAKRPPSPEPVLTIPETQQDPDMMEDVEVSIEADPDNMDISKEPTPKVVQKFYQRPPSVPPVQPLQPRPSGRAGSVQPLQPRPSGRAGSVQPLQPRPSARASSAQPGLSRVRERSGSVNGSDRCGMDAELRREIEDLKIKNETLQELGQRQAESNFDKLKKASDQKAKDANELIASLKKEIAELRKSSSSASSESTSLQKQVSALTASNEKLTKERDDFKDKHQVSQNEVKSLEAKLMVARQQLSNSAQEAKANDTANKKMNSSIAVNTSEAQKEAKMKENLYADLTGLIVRGVKRKDGEDEYDCIQTGRNGTLHFHLSIGNDATTPNPKTPSGVNYEDAEFAYEPLLDQSRDKELLEILPDYLREEICFPRSHAQRFYSKVVDSMTKGIVVDVDDEDDE